VRPGRELVLLRVDGPRVALAALGGREAAGLVRDDVDPGQRRARERAPRPAAERDHVLAAVRREPAVAVPEAEAVGRRLGLLLVRGDEGEGRGREAPGVMAVGAGGVAPGGAQRRELALDQDAGDAQDQREVLGGELVRAPDEDAAALVQEAALRGRLDGLEDGVLELARVG